MTNPIITPNLFFDNVPDALAPLSANTEYIICNPGCLDNSGNTTQHLVETPHPTFTNGAGKAIVQMNMVELGGMNGLNS